MPRGPEQLSEQASYLNLRLSDPDLDLSGARFGFQVEPANLVEKLSGSSATLQQAIEDLARAKRKTEALKLAKDGALSVYNTSFLWIARTVETLCRLAGLDEVARRVRPSSRRKGETVVKDEPPADDTTEGEAPSQASPSEAEPPETASA